MTEEKRRRIKIATIVGAVLLLAILLTVMIYQWIAIGVKRRYIDELNAKIEYYIDIKDDADKVLEARDTKEWIERRARELGYVFKDDVLYEIED
ncbi:MAG: hypothetical protein E7362_02785 [Clostridiales bacterium]|nr:hypothetical protein [Clostridiales bacterium]